jgi:NADPH2:quinone reductase
MKAAVVEDYGTPDVIKIKEIDVPVIQDDEMLVKVHASSVNTTDTASRNKPKFVFKIVAFVGRFKIDKPTETGTDVSGEIVELGKDVSKFKIGDQIYGLSRTGSCAEYAKVSERGIAIKPTSMSHSEAAAVPVAALTALQYLRDLGNIQNNQDILVYGASGGIGTYAIQYAKTFDVNVTAVSSGKNKELVKNLGADYFIDYRKEDFTKMSKKYNIIFDTVGKSPQRRWKKALKKNGIFLQAGSPTMNLPMMFLRIAGNKIRRKKMKFLISKASNEDLTLFAKLIDEGKVKSVIDKRYSLDETAKAHRYYEKGHTAGKVVIEVIKG